MISLSPPHFYFLPIWGVYAQMQVTDHSLTKTFKHIICSLTLLTSTTLSMHLAELRNPIPAVLSLQTCQKNLYHDSTHHSSTWSFSSSFLYTVHINFSPVPSHWLLCSSQLTVITSSLQMDTATGTSQANIVNNVLLLQLETQKVTLFMEHVVYLQS